MRAVLVLCLGALEAHAQPVVDEVTPMPPAAPALEVAGTWSGKTMEPKTGWRAAVIVPITSTRRTSTSNTTSLALVGRFDDHGAPAESGDAETFATSWSAGVRAMSTWATSSNLHFGVFAEGVVGTTRARHADVMASHRDDHWMVSGGLVGGTCAVQLVADFGWLVTDAGDGRIGPIASLGLRFALD